MSAEAKWARLNVSFDDSEWVDPLSDTGQLAFIKLITYTKREGRKGRVKALSPSVAVSKFRLKDHNAVMHVTEMLRAMMADSALEIVDGFWIVTNWKAYQEPDETAKERQQRWRDGQKEQNVTQHNAVTLEDNAVTPSRDNLPPTTDIYISSLSEADAPKPKREPNHFKERWEEFFSIYPKRDGDLMKSKGEQKFYSLLKSGKKAEDIIAGLKRYRSWCEHGGKIGTPYVKQITSWLNGSCWMEPYEIQSNGSLSTGPKPDPKENKLLAELRAKRELGQ